MKSDSISTILLKKIDGEDKKSHSHLGPGDEIYYLGEYMPRAGYDHSPMNQDILNFKKPPSKKEKTEWVHKENAIREIAQKFRTSIQDTTGLTERLVNAILVPIPPSAAKDDPKYDDRNYRLLKAMFPDGDIRELISQKSSRAPLHKGGRRDPKVLKEYYILDPNITLDSHHEIWLFDDILVGGTHFRAISDLFREQFPQNPIVGFFIARTIGNPIPKV